MLRLRYFHNSIKKLRISEARNNIRGKTVPNKPQKRTADDLNPRPAAVVKPILRWAGSKRKLLQELAEASPRTFSKYIEPFAGSACLFFHLQPERAILSDNNASLVQFYQTASQKPDKVLRSALHFARNESAYYSARKKYLTEKDPEKRASLFLFLNHFCFNGIFRTNTNGEFNVPFGSRTGNFPSFAEFNASAKLLKQTKLLCADFTDIAHFCRKGDFIYLDPPYVYNSRKDRGEYGTNSFSLHDIPRLQTLVHRLDRRKAKFLLSYLDCDEIDVIRKDYHSTIVPVSRTVAGLVNARQIVNEVIIKNY